jgi:GAF domain-containing protein
MIETPSSNLSLNPEEKTQNLYITWREGFVTPLLVGSLIFGLLALIPAVDTAKSSLFSTIFIVAYAIAGIIAFIPFPYSVRMSTFLSIIYILGLIELATHGILGDGLFFFLGLIIFTTMMFSPRAGIFAIAIDILTFILFGWLILSNKFIPINPDASPASLQDWISAGAVTVMFGVVIIIGFRRLEAEFLKAQKQISGTLNELTEERNSLEFKVQDRTSRLKRVNEIGRTITAILDPHELLAGAAFLIGNEFDSYYTAIYLLDPTSQWAELKEATGDAGKVLRENKHRLSMNGKSTVANAIRTKQIRIALDNGPDPVRFDNPLLPYTRSQIVMPMIVGDQIKGAIELHSTRESAFSMQDVDTFSNLANQVTIAFENSRLFNEAQQSLTEMRATQRQYLQGAWSTLASEKPLEYELGDDESADEGIEIPLTLRDQIIGQINMTADTEWTPEQKNLIESIATQAALALENARLVEESQSIASREKLANEIIAKVWSSTTIDTILQTTVRELGRALEAAEVEIEIGMAKNYE